MKNSGDASFEYAAFISYRHMLEDRKWAKKVARFLRTFRTPHALQKQGFPNRIGRLFRDDDEMPATADLKNEIRHALKSSACLIVICSPDTPNSPWVSREIELFRQMGKAHRIVPLLIAGDPETSFPEPLRTLRQVPPSSDSHDAEGMDEILEPIGGDVRLRVDERRSVTERRAMLRLAAVLLGCRLRDLEDQDKKAREKNRWQIVVGLAVSAVMGLFGVSAWYATSRMEYTSYCAAVFEQWGEARCAAYIDKGATAHASHAYRLTYRGLWTLIRMEQIDGTGRLVGDAEIPPSEASWERGVAVREYSREGKRLILRLLDDARQPLWDLRYEFADDTRSEAHFEIRDRRVGHRLDTTLYTKTADSGLGMSGVSLETPDEPDESRGQVETPEPEDQLASESGFLSGAARIDAQRVTFSPEGLLVRRMFEVAGQRLPIADGTGAYGVRYAHRADGFVDEVVSVARDGQTAWGDGTGIASMRLERDDRGRIAALSWHDGQGQPAAGRNNVSRMEFTRDGYGRVTTTRLFGRDGKAVPDRATAAARIETAYDDTGRIASLAYYDEENQPTLTRDGGYHRVAITNGADGRRATLRYLGTDQRAIATKTRGVARVDYGYDDLGQTTDERFFDERDRPVLTKDTGIARRTAVEKGGVEGTERYFGTDGRPILDKRHGAARMDGRRLSPDEIPAARPCGSLFSQNNPDNTPDNDIADALEMAFFDQEDQPVVSADLGAHRVIVFLDGRGHIRAFARYDARGQATVDARTGVFMLLVRFDHAGRMVATQTVGIDCRPIVDTANGFAGATFTYDDHGRMKQASLFDDNGARTVGVDGFSAKERIFDGIGQLVEEIYLGTDGKPTVTRQGVAKTVLIYDDRRNVTEQRFIGPNGGRIKRYGEMAVARLVNSYDKRGNRIRWSQYDEQGRLLRTPQSPAHQELRYDRRDNVVSVIVLDDDGLPACDGAGRRLQFTVAVTRNHLLMDGCARVEMTYDDRDRVVRAVLRGPEGHIRKRDDPGFAYFVRSYDERGYVKQKEFFDTDGKPASDPTNGCHTTVFVNDALGKNLSASCFGLNGEPILFADGGWHRYQKDYDERGLFAKETYFDAAGNPKTVHGGYASYTERHDEHGNLIEQAWRDDAGRPARTADGHATIRFEYDRRALRRVDYLDETGSSVTSRWGYARLLLESSKDGRHLSERYFGIDGEPVNADGGFARLDQRLDANGRLLEETHWDDDSQLTDDINGVATITHVYDAAGNETLVAFFNAWGKPAQVWNGWARVERQFDPQGRNTMITQFSAPDDRGNGQVSRETRTYHPGGALAEIAWFSNEAASQEPYRRMAFEYDATGTIVETVEYYSFRWSDGAIPHEKVRYDPNGRVVERSFHTADGGLAPPTNVYNCSVLRHRHDQLGRLIEKTCAHQGGPPPAGVAARTVLSYDDEGVMSAVVTDRDGRVLYQGAPGPAPKQPPGASVVIDNPQ